MKWLLAALSAVTLLFLPQLAYADLKPVLTLIEYGGWSGIGHPWPVGLQLVVYDNGLIIQQRPSEGDAIGNVRFVSKQGTAADAKALVAQVKAGLHGVKTDEDTHGLPTDQGWTIIQYRDPETSDLTELSTYAMPCLGPDGESPYPFAAEARAATNPKFIAICDELLRLELAAAVEWHPAEMSIVLIAKPAKPDIVREWPADWPREWKQAADGKARMICVPLDGQPKDLSAELLAGTAIGKSIGVEEAPLAWWVVGGYKIAMPGAIRLANGADRPLLQGPCSTAASP